MKIKEAIILKSSVQKQGGQRPQGPITGLKMEHMVHSHYECTCGGKKLRKIQLMHKKRSYS